MRQFDARESLKTARPKAATSYGVSSGNIWKPHLLLYTNLMTDSPAEIRLGGICDTVGELNTGRGCLRDYFREIMLTTPVRR